MKYSDVSKLFCVLLGTSLLGAACGRTQFNLRPCQWDTDCDDGVSCTVDRCDPSTQTCRSTPDDSLCGPNERCDPVLGCVAVGPCQSDADCDDGVDCTVDRCGDQGCEHLPNPDRCPPGQVCDPEEGCVHRPCTDDLDCDDGDPCTVSTCEGGSCVQRLRDRDNDGFFDALCGGTDCDDLNPLVNPGMWELCFDGVDNDCNGLVDCEDPACFFDPACCVPTPKRCDDGIDNDCDGLIDCEDPDCFGHPACGCVPTPKRCDDGIDNDCDGLIDCQDPDCFGHPACGCVPTPKRCDDGIDNDCNGLVDCEDPACFNDPACCVPTPKRCNDGVDNDCDGLIDCADPDCFDHQACATAECVPVVSLHCNTQIQARNDGPGSTNQVLHYGCLPGWSFTGPEIAGVFHAIQSGPVTVRISGLSADLDLFVLEAGLNNTCDPSLCIDASYQGGTSPEEVTFYAQAGRTYYMVVDGYGGAVSHFVASLECGPDPCIPTPKSCTDGIDNDCDGLIDCEDPDCFGHPACGCVPTPKSCTDGIDNDCDGLIDCADPDCFGHPACGCVPTPKRCNDGIDNDCNGLIDCEDPACFNDPACCVPTPKRCNDGIDNDCNGLIDCEDPACFGHPVCGCVPTPKSCTDGVDNDCDGLIDCADPDCAGDPACGQEQCVPVISLACNTQVQANNNGPGSTNQVLRYGCQPGWTWTGPEIAGVFHATHGGQVTARIFGLSADLDLFVLEAGPGGACDPDLCIDGSWNGGNQPEEVTFQAQAGRTYHLVVDGWNGAVSSFTASLECGPDPCIPTPKSCNDGIDNDCDGLIDCEDPDCFGHPACGCVPTPKSCTDGIDNDCNGLVDCEDPACFGDPVCGCVPTPKSCTDGIDNDCNGLVDCEDPACFNDSACCVPTPKRCNDGIDNDCNGLVDCEDPACFGDPVCGCVPTPKSCTDGIDNDCNGLVDCEDPACAGDPACGQEQCVPVVSLACNTQVQANNNGPGSTNQVLRYGCHQSWTWIGPEIAGVFHATQSGQVTARISGLTADLDLFVLEAGSGGVCDPDLCIDGSWNGGTQPEEVTFQAQAGRTYHLVVDGWNGAVSSFTASLECEPDPCIPTPKSCTDGIDNDCNGLVDCEDPACMNDPACCLPSPKSCIDGIDNDCDGLIDCQDPDCATHQACFGQGDCLPRAWVVCGSVLHSNNSWPGSTNNIDSYGCGATGKTGPEMTYAFTMNSFGTITVRMTPQTGNLDLFLLSAGGESCDPDNCVEQSVGGGTNIETISRFAWPGQTFYIVVDGHAGAVSDFQLQITCQGFGWP